MLKTLARLTACSLLLAGLSTALAPAQEAVLNDFYGSGVHNFYERDYMQAMHNLSVAIDGGSRDPRPFYYRGLAKLKSGDTYGGQADMQMGASLESADVNGFYPVARSLERIQGSDRQTLEKYRAVARAQNRQRQMRRDAVRYEQRRREETRVLRAVPVGPPPAPLVVAPPVAPAPAPAAAAPAPAPGAAPAAAPPATDVPPTPADEAPTDDPFNAPAEAPAGEENPFGEAPADAPAAAAPAAEAPAAEAPAASDENPFGDDPNGSPLHCVCSPGLVRIECILPA
jgi:hypothetical protein